MAAATEALSAFAQGFHSSALKRPVTLGRGDSRLLLDGDGAIRCLDSLSEGRVIFGRSQLYFFKVQAGIVVAAQRPDWSVRFSPVACHFYGRVFDGLDIVQDFEFPSPLSAGCVRRVRLRNAGASSIRLRIFGMFDPTAAHFRELSKPWGSLGVNAFNRESHVAMDEISSPHQARVIGSSPAPDRFFMTTDKGRAVELLQGGETPESTAGMSGQVLVLSLHELELSPSESKEFMFASFYSPNKLEEVLSDFGRIQAGEHSSPRMGASLVCSSPIVGGVFGWACSSMEGAQFEKDPLDRLELLRGLEYVDPVAVEALIGRTRGLVAKDGCLGYPEDRLKPDVLETSLFLSGASRHLSMASDRKIARRFYPFLRKMAKALASRTRWGSMPLDPSIPQGWRRFIRSGYPSGEVAEVSLAAAAALSDFALVSRLLGKGDEAAEFKERSELVVDWVSKRLRDDRGFLSMSVDSSGKMCSDETVDMAVACYRNPCLRSAATSGVHRLLERDFETEYGPRTVPTSNRMYFHSAYGQGQLGGYWTRAALAFVCLSYAVGLPGIGSLSLEKVSRLILGDALRFGGVPGEFPYWVDVEGREAHGDRSDPVAGSRFVQAIVEGDLGFTSSANVPVFNPPALSTIKWLLARDLWAGEKVSLFVGRAGGKVHLFASCQRVELSQGQRFSRCEQVEVSNRGAHAISFNGPGQVLCLGNSNAAPVRARIEVAPKASGLVKRLTTALEEFEPTRGTWNEIGSVRVSPAISFDASVGPGEWKAYRLSRD